MTPILAIVSGAALAATGLLVAIGLLWQAWRARAAVRELLQRGDSTRLPHWLQPLRTELERRRVELGQLEEARQQAWLERTQALARASAAHELAREAQLGLSQARAGLEQLRATLPQRALQRNMERARTRVELERLLASANPALAALHAAAADARALVSDGAAAQTSARTAADALQLLAINARVAVERGAADELADVAAALERRCVELGAPLGGADAALRADAVGQALDVALRTLDAALGQPSAVPASPIGADADADLEDGLGVLARDLSHTMFQLQALLRESSASGQSGEGAASRG